MKACVALVVLLAACGSDSTSLVIERQSTTLAAATTDGWVSGGAVLVGTPGTFTYPQSVALRITLVDPDADPATAMPKLVTKASLSIFGTGVAEVTKDVSCQPTMCTAELSVPAAGSTMLQVRATGKDGEESDCFYYAIAEDADPATASTTLHDELETEQQKCLQAVLD